MQRYARAETCCAAERKGGIAAGNGGRNDEVLRTALKSENELSRK